MWEQKNRLWKGFLSPKRDTVEKSSQGSQFSGSKTDDDVFSEQLQAAGDSGNAEETALCPENIGNNNAQPTEEMEISESTGCPMKEIPSSGTDQGSRSHVLDTRRAISAQLPDNRVIVYNSPVYSSSALDLPVLKNLNRRLMSESLLNKFQRNIDIHDDSFNIEMTASAKLTELGIGRSGANGSDKLVTSEMKTLLKRESVSKKSKDVFEFYDEGNPTPAMSSRKRRKLKPPLSEVNSVTSSPFAVSNVDDNVKAQLSYIFDTTTPAKMSPAFSPPSKETSFTLNNVPTKESKEQSSQSLLETTEIDTTVLETTDLNTTPLPDNSCTIVDDIRRILKEIRGEMPEQPPPKVQTARFDPFVPEVAKALNNCICDHINVGMLLTVEQIKKKAWPYRIESILLSLIGDRKLPHCRYCTDSETTGLQRGVAETLSDSCFLFSWASEYRGSSWVHTIPLLKTEHVEALKGRNGTGSCYPCLGQCGIVSCGFKSLSVASLRRHIKERCTAAIKYSFSTVQEEYETGRLRQAPNILKSKIEAGKLNRDVVNERGSVWSDNCNLSHSLNSTKVQRDYKGSKQPNQSFLKRDKLDMFDIRILQLVQLLNTNDTDLLIDVLTCCFYNTLSCERCWKKVGMSEFLPNSWKRTSGQHYEYCTRPTRPTSHKSTSTRDLTRDSREGVEKHSDGMSDKGVSNNIHSKRGRRYPKASVADLKCRIRAKRNRSYLEKEEMRKRRDIRVKTLRKSDSGQDITKLKVRPENAGPKTRSRSSRGSENVSFAKPRSSSREPVPRERPSGKQSQTPLKPKRLQKSKETSKSATVLPSNTPSDAQGDHSYSVQKSMKGSGSTKSKRDIPGLAVKPQSRSSTSVSKPSSVSRGQVCVPVTSSSAINSRTVTPDSGHVPNYPSGEIPLPVSSQHTSHPDQVPGIFPFPDVSPVKARSSPTNTTPSPAISTPISSSAIPSAPPLTQPSISNLPISGLASLTRLHSPQPSTTQTPTRKVAIPISTFLSPRLSKFNGVVVGGKISVSLHSKKPVSVKTVSSFSQMVVDKSRPATMKVPVHKRVPVPYSQFVKCNTLSDLQSVLNSPKFLNSPTSSTAPKIDPVASPIFITPGDATSSNTVPVLSEAAYKTGLRLHLSPTAAAAPFRYSSEPSAASLPDSVHPTTTSSQAVPPALSHYPPLPCTSEKLSRVSGSKSPDSLQNININVTDTPADIVREELDSTTPDNNQLTVKGDVSLPQSNSNGTVAETTEEVSPMVDSTNNTITPPDDPDYTPELNNALFSDQNESVRRSQRIKVSSIPVVTDKHALLSKENGSGDEPCGSPNRTSDQRNMLLSGQLFLIQMINLLQKQKTCLKVII
ncbi:uncharacterized protein LOC134812858 [Bolinopsis microptera]|uniref:uncharacterized protein LOC134812858 n=1 Tax=Bolinopsis microptera TaxID=2820187 RepID=UPI00307A73D7